MERLKKEQEEKEHKKKEKAEAHLYTIIKVARDENLVEQIGKDIYFDLVDHDKVRSFRIQKKMPFNLLKEEVAKEFGIPVQFQRFWLWAKRQNHTYRPNRPLTPLEETQSVGQLREVPKKVHNAELKLFLEVELGLDLHPIAPPDKTKDDILLFFKLYDPEKVQLRYVGRLFVKSTGKPAEILSKLNEMGGYAPDEEIDLYEEIKFEPYVMCEPIDKTFTFRASQLGDGDIVCFQKPTPAENGAHIRYPDVPSFLDYVHNRHMSKPKHSIRALDFLESYILQHPDDCILANADEAPIPSSDEISQAKAIIHSISTLSLDEVMEMESLQNLKSSMEILLKADVQTGVQFANIENVQEKLAFVESKYDSASGITGEVNKAFNQKIELEQDVEVYTLGLTEAQKEEQKFLTCVTVQNSMIEELEKKLAAEKAILKELEEHYATHKTKMNEANNKREHAQKMLYDHLIHEKTWVKKALQAKKDLKSVEVTWVRIQQLLSLISG